MPARTKFNYPLTVTEGHMITGTPVSSFPGLCNYRLISVRSVSEIRLVGGGFCDGVLVGTMAVGGWWLGCPLRDIKKR